ncbi:MAG: rod shape-determining protein MreC [Xanthomonadales bacterium]|nr:rod shape-determining protein MreC [Xanthomonadales bacterium]
MPSYAGPSASRSDDIAGTLRLLVALALAVALMIADHRGGWLTSIRAQLEVLVQPLWRLAGLPAKLGDTVRDDAVTRTRLMEENQTLRNALLISGARTARLQAAADENARLRGLLGAVERGGLDVQLAPILDVALDPTRQRLVLDIGGNQGVRMGQPVIDAGGLLGQVIEVRPSTATVLLLTDPDHAVPVTIARNGIRLVAYGRGDRIELANIPTSGDVKIGDQVVTSGLGGRFPPGFPVGSVVRLRRDDSRVFLVGDLKPAAQLDRGRDVLLLRDVRTPAAAVATPAAGGDASAPPTGSAAATTAGTTGPAAASAVAAGPAPSKPAAGAAAGNAANAATPAAPTAGALAPRSATPRSSAPRPASTAPASTTPAAPPSAAPRSAAQPPAQAPSR